jgi:hypothetical protein
MSQYYVYISRKQKTLWDIDFWQQTLWSLLFPRGPCCPVHCCQCCRPLIIDRKLLHSKRRYQCTRLHGATVTHIFVTAGDKGSFAIHLNMLQLQLCHHRLCGLVVRVSGYRSRGPGFDLCNKSERRATTRSDGNCNSWQQNKSAIITGVSTCVCF